MKRQGVAGSRSRAVAAGAEFRTPRVDLVLKTGRREPCDGRGDNSAMHPGLIPPDIDSLPPLPERFTWQLPHVKQHRRPTPEGRQIVVDGEGPAVASVQPGIGSSSIVIGVHRWEESGRRHHKFAKRETALRYAAAWAWRR
ncbi:MAG: hypothetical protein ACREP7_05450 [Lysobacter sp.]